VPLRKEPTTATSNYREAFKPFRSYFEQSIANNLIEMDCSFEYEPMRIPYEIKSKYIPDFVLPNGIIIEAKGRLLAKDARKHRAVKKRHPNLDIRFVFMSLSTRVENSRFTHQEWATKYGFRYFEKVIPKVWIDEIIKHDKSDQEYVSEFRKKNISNRKE